jgi:hypothetical protein
MPNPSGVNGYEPPGPEIPYGQKQIDSAVQRLAPLAGQGTIASLTNAPRRDASHAERGTSAGAAAPAPPTLLIPATPSVDAQVAGFWQQAAAEPGSTPLIQSIAQDAAKRAAGGS